MFSPTPVTEFLFGDDLKARMASIKVVNKISQSTATSGKANTPINVRHPYNSSKRRQHDGSKRKAFPLNNRSRNLGLVCAAYYICK